MRRSFTPAQQGRGHYRLPHDVRDRLASALAPFRNRDAAFALAEFLGRFWSAPGRIVESFHIDRRALADHTDLLLSEAKVRGAIRVLEEIGFLDRALSTGSRYKPTEDGLRRRPIRFVFGSEYGPLFLAANKRAATARGRVSSARRSMTPASAPRPSTALPEARLTNSPKSKTSEAERVYLGEIRKSGLPPATSEPNPRLESALDRLLQGIRQSRGG